MSQQWYPPFYHGPPGPPPPFGMYQYGPPPGPPPPFVNGLPNGMMNAMPRMGPSPMSSPIGVQAPLPSNIFPTQSPFYQPPTLVQDANGWYQQRPRSSPPIPQPTEQLPESSTQVNDYWKGKLGALPGMSSNPNTNPGLYNLPYLTLRNSVSSAITIRAPPRKKNRRKRRPRTRKRGAGGNGSVGDPAKPSNGEDEGAESQTGSEDSDSESQTPNEPSSSIPLDAEAFVPEYLQAIQRQPHNFRLLEPAPLFPSSTYLSDSILTSNRRTTDSILSTPPDSDQRCPPLSASTYHKHFLHVLQDELSTVVANKAQIILWRIPVSLADTIGDRPISPRERQIHNNVLSPDAKFVIFVPGIRENHPRLDIGDTVHLREVLVERQTGSGIAFEARVSDLRKREGLVLLHCPSLQAHVRTYWGLITPRDFIPMCFNVSFLTNARPFVAMDEATSLLDDMLIRPAKQSSSSDSDRTLKFRSVAHRWLFPEPLDVLLDPPVLVTLPENGNLQWVDSGLNCEQKTAAASISQYRSPIPYLISGPPGTGKTRTVVESVYQILCVMPNSHILLCAPSNSATDTLALRLAQGGLLKPNELLRLNDKDRTFAEVPDSIRAFCYVEEDKFALPPFKALMSYRVVVTCCLDANILVAAKCTNSFLTELEEAVMNSIHPTGTKHTASQPHWTHLLIDEAAQASEPEVDIPISVVVTSQSFQEKDSTDSTRPDTAESNNNLVPQLVLCGDPNQLGPIVTSHNARNNELDVSLLERLFERPIYADHPLARAKISWLNVSQGTEAEFFHPKLIRKHKSLVPFVNLVKNYRSHPAILMPPSAIFYNDSLEPCAQNGRINWSGLANPDLPLVFIGNEGKEQSVDERATWFNMSEIARVVETVISLMSERDNCSPPLQVSDIGVIAPWREQVWKLREKLREERLGSVDVGSVEDYQGRENRVIIISAVRSSLRFITEDSFKGVGLMFEKKRMNVSITRAKELLIVIGNGDTLKRDPYWRSFLQFALRNKLYVGPPLNIEMDGSYISRLESRYINRDGEAEAEEQGLLFAGGVAREILREDD